MRKIDGDCGEVVNASDCGSDIRGFDSHQSPHHFIVNWAMAKWLRHRTLTPRSVVQIYLAQPFFLRPASSAGRAFDF